jgi:hypothetical protein
MCRVPLSVVAFFALLGATLVTAGCAHTEAEQSAAASPSSRIEDDGLPSQVAPPAGIRQQPDDPSEPYSPNYGGPRAPLPDNAKRATTAALQSWPMTRAEQEMVILRAISAHEMRNP